MFIVYLQLKFYHDYKTANSSKNNIQSLHSTTLLSRYIKFDLMKDVPFSVRFHECIYKELKYKPRVGVNGVSGE